MNGIWKISLGRPDNDGLLALTGTRAEKAC